MTCLLRRGQNSLIDTSIYRGDFNPRLKPNCSEHFSPAAGGAATTMQPEWGSRQRPQKSEEHRRSGFEGFLRNPLIACMRLRDIAGPKTMLGIPPCARIEASQK